MLPHDTCTQARTVTAAPRRPLTHDHELRNERACPSATQRGTIHLKTLAVLIGITGIVPAAAGSTAPSSWCVPTDVPRALAHRGPAGAARLWGGPAPPRDGGPTALNLFVLAPLMYLSMPSWYAQNALLSGSRPFLRICFPRIAGLSGCCRQRARVTACCGRVSVSALLFMRRSWALPQTHFGTGYSG